MGENYKKHCMNSNWRNRHTTIGYVFWHGYNWEERKKDFKSHQEFWIPKIERNMERDAEVTARLESEATPSSVCPKRKYSSRKWTTCNNRAHF